jgi:predicted lipoprotein
VRVAFDAVKDLQTTIATEVVAELGVTVGFSDSDGDAAG